METRQITVNNKQYVLTKWDAMSALMLQIKLTKMIGSALGGIDKVSSKDLQNLMSADVGMLLSNIGNILERVDEDKLFKLIQELLGKNIKSIKTDGQNDIQVPLVLASLELMEMYELAFEVVKLNMGKFMDDIKSKLNSKSVKQSIES